MKRAKQGGKAQPGRPAAAQSRKTQSGDAGILLWIAAILVAAVGVFWLPWNFSSITPAVGESYSLGFNNHLAAMALAVALLLGVGAAYFSARRPSAYKWLAENPRIFPPWREARAEYVILISMCTVMTAWILIWSSYLVDPSWCEGRIGVHGMDMVALGQTPYRDFMYSYGWAMIYLPLWLSKITGGAISFEQSLAWLLVLFTVGGHVGTFAFLRRLEIPKGARAVVLGAALLAWLCLTMGVHYTVLRFLIVPASLVFLDTVASRQTGVGLASAIWTGLAAALAVGAGLAISTEMGVATTVAVAAYGFVLALRRSIPAAAACLIGTAAVFCATLQGFPGYLDSIFNYSFGSYNFPIYPNLYNVGMVGMSLFTLPALSAAALANPAEKRAPLSLALAAGGGMLLPVAFGRCDPGHVIINGIIPALMMFPAMAATGKMAFRIWTAAYLAVFVVTSEIGYWYQYIPNFKEGISMHEYYAAHPDQVAAWAAKWEALRLASPHGKDLHWSKVLPFPDGLDQLTSKGRVLMTGDCEGNMWLSRYLLLQKDPPREYFDAFSLGASTPAQLERRVKEDEAYRYLMVPQSAMQMLNGSINLSAYQQSLSNYLSKLLQFPVNSEVKNAPYMPDTEYARRIINDYKPIGKYGSFVILEKKGM